MCIELIFPALPMEVYPLLFVKHDRKELFFVLNVDGGLKTALIPGNIYVFGCWQAIAVPIPQFEVSRGKTGFCNEKS